MKTVLKILALLGCCALLPAGAQPSRANAVAAVQARPLQPGDHIAAVVNQ